MSNRTDLLESDDSFSGTLYRWMNRAPWLAISAAAHLLLVVFLLAIPWDELREHEPPILRVNAEAPPPETFESPPLEPEPPVEPMLTDEIREPELVPLADSSELANTDSTDAAPTEGDPDRTADAPFDLFDANPWIGIGGGAGGKLGSRFPGPGGRRGGGDMQPYVRDGLEWLAAHQSADGSWDCDGFSAQCGSIGATTCGDPGEATHDVGVTGLALLAFLGDGNTTRIGAYKENVSRGIAWLKSVQDPDTGLFGEKAGHGFLYDHAIATLAVCEAYYFSSSPLLRRCAQDAANYVALARNPYGAWRYDVPPSGDDDTSVTGWCVFALKSAQEAGLEVDPQAYAGALSWLDEVSDPATGRCGYDSIGSTSSRIERVNDQFPADRGEAMTAVALLCRVFLGQEPDETPMMRKHASLLRAKLPRWDEGGFGIDLYYWYYGSYAMYQLGGKDWEAWNKALKSAVVESQRKDGDEKGSWDARVDAWGFSGGRVYTTALGVLCLEVYYRYARVLGGR
jgi:hypothetical protein